MITLLRPANSRSPRVSIVPSRVACLRPLLLFLFAVLRTTPSPAATRPLWGTNGPVTAIARSGDTLYIGGAFDKVGPCTGGGVPLNVDDGRASEPYARINGTVNAVAPDGRGGWFVGGKFIAVDGVPRTNLAHILADGVLDDWAPVPNDAVECLLVERSSVFIAGGFSQIDGYHREYIAALDARSGRVLPWDAKADYFVSAMAFHAGTLYVGGGFSAIGGEHRTRLAALDTRSGRATSWAPESNGTVTTLTLQGNTIYVGGEFRQLNGEPRRSLAALDATSAAVLDWNPGANRPEDSYDPTPMISTVVVVGTKVYIGGGFTTIGGVARGGLASLDSRSGMVSDWDPHVTQPNANHPTIHALLVSGRTVYIGGVFGAVGGQARVCLAAIDAVTGTAAPWNPRPNGRVRALSLSGRTVFAGGDFFMLGDAWRMRRSLAALSTTTGELLDWDPNGNIFDIKALVVTRGTVYMAGDFDAVGGELRKFIAGVDARTGLATPWNPGANWTVSALLLHGSTLYAGGDFTALGGQPRAHAGAFNLTTGELTEWNPSANDGILALAARDSIVFAGGWFNRIGGRLLNGLAALDLRTGAATEWNPGQDGLVTSLAVSESTVYVGGWFNQLAGQPRENLGGVDARTGAATPWSSGTSNLVNSIAVSGGTIYAGGFFQDVGGITRNFIASFDAHTGALSEWNPNAGGPVWSLLTSGSTLFAGGGFAYMGSDQQVNIAVLPIGIEKRLVVQAAVGRPMELGLECAASNPVRSIARLRVGLPAASIVTLSVFDIQGRRLVTPLDRVMRSAGAFDVSIPTLGWRDGFYFARLDVAGASVTRKLLVMH